LAVEGITYHFLYRKNATINASQTRRQEILEESDKTSRTYGDFSKLSAMHKDYSTLTLAFDGTNCSHGSQKKSNQLKKIVRIGAPLDAISGLSFLNNREIRFCP
jgi:hypothetical protein